MSTENQFKGTPGEWVMRNTITKGIDIMPTDTPFEIATVEHRYRYREVVEANANLIASAPKMLAMLMEAKESFDLICNSFQEGSNEHRLCASVLNRIDDTISKALGHA